MCWLRIFDLPVGEQNRIRRTGIQLDAWASWGAAVLRPYTDLYYYGDVGLR